jgi:hypothetical protein
MIVIRKRAGPWVAMSLWLVACGGGGFEDGAAPTGSISFRRDVAPVFSGSCNFCHHPGTAIGIDLTRPFDPTTGIIRRANTWKSAAATLIVDPGNLPNSFLIHKVERTDLDAHIEGNRMPWNVDRLTPDEIAAIRRWITDGAKNDGFYQASVAPIFGDGMSLGSAGGKCSYCHYPGTPQPPDLTHPFDATTGVVNVESKLPAGKRVVPGDPDASFLVKKIEAQPGSTAIGGAAMPMQIPLLSQGSIDALKAWINAGAKND